MKYILTIAPIFRHSLAALCACLMLAVAMPAISQEKDKATIDRAQAAKKAQQQVKGRVLKVDPSRNKQKYRVKVLQKSGRVVQVDVDKKSGRVSKPKKDKDR